MTTLRWFGQREEAGEPEFYIYDEVPDELRGKIRFAILDCLDRVGKLVPSIAEDGLYKGVTDLVSRALGREIAGDYKERYHLKEFLSTADFVDLFRGIEGTLDYLTRLASVVAKRSGEENVLDEAVRLQKDLNKLFGHYRLGYKIVVLDRPADDEPFLQIIRIDSEFTHREMVKPTLRLLQQEGFQTASRQFSDALGEYSDAQYEDAVTDANSAFESVLKRVLDREEGTAAQLIQAAEEQGYFPKYLKDSLVHYGKLLQALPTVRHKEGDAHGKLQSGQDPERFARFAIHLAAANIIFIMDEYNRRGGKE